jgi:hypothetical protein
MLHHLRTTHRHAAPVFVIGYARSGTRLVCRLMRQYLLANSGAERSFSRPEPNQGVRHDPEVAVASLRGRHPREVHEVLGGQLASHHNLALWDDQIPPGIQDLARLAASFPDAQFVHAVRDGRDVALSIPQTTFSPQNVCECAQDWGRTQQTIRAFAARLAPGQFHEVRYEDLTTRPLETLRDLGAFLGVDVDETIVAAMRAGLPADVRPGNGRKFQYVMHPRELERFEGVAAHSLTAAGYPLALQGYARRIGAIERWSWRLHGRTVRLTRRDALRDTAYRLRLRATAIARLLLAAPFGAKRLPRVSSAAQTQPTGGQ